METKPFSLQSPEQIAKDYGGNKQQIAQAAQVGLLDPTAAVLAGMFIDRMRSAQMEEQAPNQTVAQEVFMPQQQPQMGAAPGMAPPMGQPMQQPMPQGAPQTGAGLDALPVPNEMFAGQGMASGGLVAFAEAGSVRDQKLREQQARDQERLKKAIGYTGIADIATFVPRAGMGLANLGIRGVRAAGFDAPYFPYGLYTGTDIDMAPFSRNILASAEADAEDEAETEADKPEGKEDVTLDEDVVDAELPRTRGPGSPAASTTPTAGEPVPAEASALDRYTQMLLGGMQDRDATREEAKNMALLQAGLGIMGGQSPYALQNIAQGALPATQAYQQQMAQARKEERETIGELANIEVKAKELGLTEQRYKDLMTIAGMQIAASGASDSMRLRSDIVRLAIEEMKAQANLGNQVSLPEVIQQATMALTGQVPSGAPQTQTIPFANLGK